MDSIAFIICFRFNITPIPASSLTLQYFAWIRANEYPITPIRHGYLATIHLMYIENGFPDPTTDESFATTDESFAPTVQRYTPATEQFKAADHNQPFKNTQISVVLFSDVTA